MKDHESEYEFDASELEAMEQSCDGLRHSTPEEIERQEEMIREAQQFEAKQAAKRDEAYRVFKERYDEDR